MLVEKPKDYKFYQFRMVGDKVVEYKRIVAHHSIVDPFERDQINVAEQLGEWSVSDRGKWIMENAAESLYYDWYRRAETYTTEFKVIATFELKKLSEYYLRFS